MVRIEWVTGSNFILCFFVVWLVACFVIASLFPCQLVEPLVRGDSEMPIYDEDSLNEIYRNHWKMGWGSIAKDEVLFVQELIENYRPRDFIEIGMASGLSGGILANILEEIGAKTFTTIDYDNTFFGDSSKENGFLLSEIYSGSAVTVEKHPFTTSLDLSRLGKKFQMAFIDANHQHPWPALDTLCLYPFLEGEKIIIHHDLKLFKEQDVVYGIGPKYLYDQFADEFRIDSDANRGNIYALHLKNTDPEYIAKISINALSLSLIHI